MDDLLAGTETLEDAIQLQRQMNELSNQGSFPLCKWRSNDPRVLAHLSEECKTNSILVLDKEDAIKVLGMLWDSRADIFKYRVLMPENPRATKRSILSCNSQIYDPLGLLGPVLMQAKLIMQQLWQLELGWDEALPQHIYTAWLDYYSSLPMVNKIVIPRNINPNNATLQFDLHGFGDASEKGYGACVYAVSKSKTGELNSILICSKSRVAPLKIVTLPRLELSAALLLSRLVNMLQETLKKRIRNIHLWSDSTIVLHWIQTEPNVLKTFAANRVAEIQRRTEEATWHHVRSNDQMIIQLTFYLEE